MPRIPGCVPGGGKLSTRDKKKRQMRFEHEESDYLTLPQIKEAVSALKNASFLPKAYAEYAAYDAFAVEKLHAVFNKAMDKVGYQMADSMDEDFTPDDTFSFGYGEI